MTPPAGTPPPSRTPRSRTPPPAGRPAAGLAREPVGRPGAGGEPALVTRGTRRAESLLRGGLTGIALVTAATLGLAAAAGLVALLVSLLYG